MTFNSYLFILAFLPLFLLLYFTAGKRSGGIRKGLIILGGAVFYLYAGWEGAAVMGVSLGLNYLLARAIFRAKRAKPWLALAVAVNVGLLFFFKYALFTVNTMEELTGRPLSSWRMVLPLGISFFTFHQIMYVSAVGRGEIMPELADYLAYMLFFPKMIMGPLMEPADFLGQLGAPESGRVNWAHLASGLKLFSYGLFKKVLLADTFAKAVAWGFANGVGTLAQPAAATSYDLLLVMLCYTFQIYFDFSGYSDMATGVAQMMNISLPINFDSPYKAVSIRDFWKRWHVSLTRFLTKYIYIPLGGSRQGKARTCLNILIVFLISGIWHGANWTFLLWGCLHGLLQILERLGEKHIQRLPRFFRWGCTFLCVSVLWMLFRADSIGDWAQMMGRMFSFRYRIVSPGLLQAFELPEITMLMDALHLSGLYTSLRGAGLGLFLAAAFLICLIPKNNYRNMEKTGVRQLICSVILFLWSFLCLSSESVFVYFNF